MKNPKEEKCTCKEHDPYCCQIHGNCPTCVKKEEPKQENCCTPLGQIKRYVDCYGCDRDFKFLPDKSKFIECEFAAPTFSHVFKFFREKYKLPSWVYTSDNEKFYYGILRDTRLLIDGNKPYETYEEAELACLLKLIEVVKNK